MNNVKKLTGLSLAIAAASMVGCVAQSDTKTANAGAQEMVHCSGVNKCAGHNDCKTADNACKGMVACKGQGFVALTPKACADVGGTAG